MRTLLRVVGFLLGLTVLVAIGSVIAFAVLFDPNDYRDDIAALVAERTGRELTIEGDLGISLFPWLGFEVGRMTLANAESYGDTPLAAITQADARVKLQPLLFERRIEIGAVELSGLRLNLAVDRQGRGNWQDVLDALQREPADAAQPAAEPDPSPEAGQNFSLESLTVERLLLDDAAASYADAGSGARYEVRDLDLTTGRIAAGEPFPVDLAFKLTSSAPALAVDAALSTQLRYALDDQIYGLTDLQLRGEITPADAEPIPLQIGFDAVADLAADTLRLAGVQLSSGALAASGRANISSFTHSPSYEGLITLAPFSPRAVLSQYGVELPAGNPDQPVLEQAELRSEFTGTGERISLRQLKAQLDRTQLQGELGLRFGGEVPQVNATLLLDQLNLDAYLGTGNDAAEAGETTAGGGGDDSDEGGEAVIPLEILRAFEGEIALQADALTVADVDLTQVELQGTLREGRLRVAPLRTALYGGQLDGTLVVDASGPTPDIRLTQRLDHIVVGEALQDLAEQVYLTGLGDFAITLNTRGNAPMDLRRNLSGELDLAFAEGAFGSFNLLEQLRQAYGEVRSLRETAQNLGLLERDESAPETAQLPTADGERGTPFTTLRATGAIRQGVFRNEDLRLEAPGLRLTGAGSIDLVQETVDYTVQVVLPKGAFTNAPAWVSELQGQPIPVRIAGALGAPSVRPDLQSVLRSRLDSEVGKQREDVRQQLEKETGELREKVQERLGEELRGLFGD